MEINRFDFKIVAKHMNGLSNRTLENTTIFLHFRIMEAGNWQVFC